jgi:transcriptional regulator with XRE-family HTH domain
MTNKENFLALVSKEEQKTVERNRERIQNRAMLRESQQIALKVLLKLDDLGWTQKDLAKAMVVSPQQITKIVSGKENLTIETQIKLQNILDIPVLASYYENNAKKLEQMILTFEERVDKIVAKANYVNNRYQSNTANFQKTYDYKLSIAS